jgi:hypothetical protein
VRPARPASPGSGCRPPASRTIRGPRHRRAPGPGNADWVPGSLTAMKSSSREEIMASWDTGAATDFNTKIIEEFGALCSPHGNTAGGMPNTAWLFPTSAKKAMDYTAALQRCHARSELPRRRIRCPVPPVRSPPTRPTQHVQRTPDRQAGAGIISLIHPTFPATVVSRPDWGHLRTVTDQSAQSSAAPIRQVIHDPKRPAQSVAA